MTIMEEIFAEQAKDLTKNMAYFIYGRNLVDRVLKTQPDVKLKQSNEEVEANVTNKQEEKPVKHEKKEETATYSVETENSTDNKEAKVTINEENKGKPVKKQDEKLNLALEEIIIEHAKDLTKDTAYIAYGKDLVDNVLKTYPDVKFKQSDEETEASKDNKEVNATVNKENKGKPVEQETIKAFEKQKGNPAIAAYSEKAKASTDKEEANATVNEENKGKHVKKQEKKRNKMREWVNRITGRKERETSSKVEEIYDPNNDKILLNIDAAKKAGNMSVLYTSLYELADIVKQLSNKLRDRFDKNVAKQLDCYISVLNYFQIKVE